MEVRGGPVPYQLVPPKLLRRPSQCLAGHVGAELAELERQDLLDELRRESA